MKYTVFYFFITQICAVGWEIWFTYGLLGGDPVDHRRPEPLNTLMPKHVNWILNSLADGSICMVAILLMFIGKIFSENELICILKFSEKEEFDLLQLVWPYPCLCLVHVPEYCGGDGCL